MTFPPHTYGLLDCLLAAARQADLAQSYAESMECWRTAHDLIKIRIELRTLYERILFHFIEDVPAPHGV